jgi:hypothetical protein
MNDSASPIFILVAALAFFNVACQSQSDDGKTGVASGQSASDISLGHGYVRRGETIHFLGGEITGSGVNATRIDRPSPQVLQGFRDAKMGPFETCEGLDVETFEPLSEEYSRDRNHVYFKVISPGVFLVIKLPEADPGSFEVLAPSLGRDQTHVWLDERIQSGADPATVQVVNAGFSVFKDEDSVHYQNQRIPGADPKSFRHLASGYYADQNRIYWGSEAIAGAEVGSFQVLGDSFLAKDQNRAYRSGQVLPGLAVATLSLILHDPVGYQIYADKNGIYVNGQRFPRSRPGKVEVIDQATVKVDDLILLVELAYNTPITVFREGNRLMAEAPVYQPANREIQGMICMTVAASGVTDIRIDPVAGRDVAPAVPAWQMEVLKRSDNVKRMVEAGQLLK